MIALGMYMETSAPGPPKGFYEILRKKKIVLVEDDPWIQNGLKMFFRHVGCDLIGFETAAPALEMMAKEQVDIIITDYWLPDIDGLTLFRRVRDRQPEARCILITAYPSDGIRDEATRIGIHEFISKPLTIQKIEAALGRLI